MSHEKAELTKHRLGPKSRGLVEVGLISVHHSNEHLDFR